MTDRGRFVWHELLTTDTKAAAAFYTKVIGWKTQRWPSNPDYTLFVTGKSMMGGLMTIPAEAKAMGAPPNWCTYIGTPDVDETARLAERVGGTILRQPDDIPEVGRFAIVRDPQGAVFALFSSPQEQQPEKASVDLGDFSWHELVTTDWEAAFEFYQRLFGWEKTESMDMGEMGIYQMYGRYGRSLGGMFNKPSQTPGPPFWLPYTKVKDAKLAAQLTAKHGGKVINGPMEVPGGDWITQGMDPQGAMFAVHSVTPVAKSQGASGAKPAKQAVAKKVARAAVAKKAVVKAAKRKVASVRKKVAKAKRKVARTKRRVVRKVARRKAVRRAVRRIAVRSATRKVVRKVRRAKRSVRRTVRRVKRAVRASR